MLGPWREGSQAARKGFERVSSTIKTIFRPHILTDLRKRGQAKWIGKWKRSVARMAQALPSAQSFGNDVELFTTGNKAYGAMWAAIAGAKERVWLEAYIFEPDYVGRTTLHLLGEAAERGCDVFFIYDQFGSMDLNESLLADLRAAGAHVVEFEPILWRWPKSLRAPLFRNHRKVLVVDDEMAFCGGMNISVDYAGGAMGSGRYRDTHARVTGPSLHHLARVVLNSATMTTTDTELLDKLTAIQEKFEAKQRTRMLEVEDTEQPERAKEVADALAAGKQMPVVTEKDRGVFVQVLESNYSKNKLQILQALVMTLDSAQQFCFLCTPYFVPPRRLREAIVRAANRGVDVRIMTSGRSEVLGIQMAGQHVYGLFLRNNVRMYEMTERELHAKTITCDGIYSMVGSYNLDRISYKHNLEVNLTFINPSVATQLEMHFGEDSKNAKEVTLENWERRGPFAKTLHWFAYHCIRFIWK